MSDYKIFHRRDRGTDVWQVFYKGEVLNWWHPDVMESAAHRDRNVYYQLDNAKGLISLHKEHLKWLRDNKKEDVEEWLDEEGNQIPPAPPTPPTRRIVIEDDSKARQPRKDHPVAVVIIVVFVLAIVSYLFHTI